MKNETTKSIDVAAAAAAAAAAELACLTAKVVPNGRPPKKKFRERGVDEILKAVSGREPDPSALSLQDLIDYDANELDPERRQWVEHRLRTSLRAAHDLLLLREMKQSVVAPGKEETTMTLHEKIREWKEYPNALGSESHAAVIVGEVAAALGEPIPKDVEAALKVLSLRGVMRDLSSAIQRRQDMESDLPSFHDIADAAGAAAGLSWAEAVAVVSRYFAERQNRLT